MQLRKILQFLFLSTIITACSDKTAKIQVYKTALVAQIDKIDDFQLESILSKEGQFGTDIFSKPYDISISDNEILTDTLFSFGLEPLSNAIGKDIDGNVTYFYNQKGEIAQMLTFSSDHQHIYIWPDDLAKLSEPKNPDNSILVDELLSKLYKHAYSRYQYMSVPDREDAIDAELLHPKSIYILGESDVKESKGRFDLSGLAMRNDTIYCISDKLETSSIYTLDTASDGKFYINVVNTTPDEIKVNDIDIEAIDVLDNKILIADEHFSKLYLEYGKNDFRFLDVKLNTVDTNIVDWGVKNSGIEGIAVCGHKIYVSKERSPRRVFVYDLDTKTITEPFRDIVLPTDGDISDLKVNEKYLYILDRQNCYIRRLELETGQSTYLSFRKFSNDKHMHNYYADYGMAEALLLTKDAIFVGFDNNNDTVSDFGVTVGLPKGCNKPSIFVFKRPEDF